MEKPEFVNTPNGQIIPWWMKSKSNERFIGLKFFFNFEVKHSKKFAAKILIIPDPDSAVKITTSCNQRSLLTYIHSCDRIVMETFVDILEYNLFICYIVDEVWYLRNQLTYVESCNVIIC